MYLGVRLVSNRYPLFVRYCTVKPGMAHELFVRFPPAQVKTPGVVTNDTNVLGLT